MTFRGMKILLKKGLFGNLVATFVVGGIVFLYILLLRYNTANTHFDIRSHDIRKRYIRDDPLQIKVPWKKLLYTNVWKSKSGNWTRKIGPNSPLSVFIVEEHHEVIPYWFDAANAKAIPHHGNTLIHIDGHDDMAIPVHFPEFPTFRWPKTKQDFKLLMQRNDVFIVEAIISGLIKRVVWVWPMWDQKNHNSTYTAIKNQFGIATVKGQDNTPYQVFCICEVSQKTPGNKCEYIDYEAENVTSVPISKSRCKTKRTVLYEEVREDIAAKLMKDTKWLADKDTVILDIDEDFYGCVYASKPLLDVGIKEKDLKLINLYLSKLVCPKSLAQEKYADNVFSTALEFYKRYYDCKNQKQPSQKNKCKTLAKTSTQVTSYLQKILWQNKKIHLCSKQHHAVKYAISELVNSFQKLSLKQIKPMQRVGFCLNTSPKTFKVTVPSFFHVCMGANTPSDSAVLIYNPSKQDIADRTVSLQNMLQSFKTKSLKLVTVCRSSRDGYTPRRFSKLIETNILASLNKTFNNQCAIHYDGGLLGGVKGWALRQRKFDRKLFL